MADNFLQPSAPRVPATTAAAPSPVVAAPDARTSGAATAPATSGAVIIFTNSPGTRCGTCDTLKISVAPSGQILIEHGEWASPNRNWRYRRSVVHVGPDRVTAFAASLSGDRPSGAQTPAAGGACAGAATEDDGLVIEWIEAERHDRLTFAYGCAAGRNSRSAERLRHAPDLLGLRGLVWPERRDQ